MALNLQQRKLFATCNSLGPANVMNQLRYLRYAAAFNLYAA